MKKYVTRGIRGVVDAKIEEVEVERETDASVWINGDRSQKVSEWKIYHDTWEAAHRHLITKAKAKVFSAQASLAHAERSLEEVQEMKKP